MSRIRDAVVWAAVGGAAVWLVTGARAPAGGSPGATAVAGVAAASRGAFTPCFGDLNNDGAVNTGDLVLFLGVFGSNCPVDSDGDGVQDAFDNCPTACNPGQEDADADGVGDRCDNCLFLANPGQVDLNSNGVGDSCEGLFGDADFDGAPDSIDTCAGVFNPDQLDSDFDGLGNACDNCPFHINPGQQDTDNDGIGDACEGTGDFDGDGVALEQGDCDDFDSSRYPGAPDPCGDGIDQNCDGRDG